MQKRYGALGIVYLATFISVYFLHKHAVLLLAAEMVLWAAAVVLTRFRYIRASVGAMFFGPLAEVVSIRGGAWQYTDRQLPGGIPIWLPVLWGIACICFLVLAEFWGEVVHRKRS
jgi:hypothetical protein